MIRVSVTVDQQHLAVIGEVAEVLRSRGMQVEQVLTAIGIVIGSLPDERRSALDSVDGVQSVDEQRRFQLPPPDSVIQ